MKILSKISFAPLHRLALVTAYLLLPSTMLLADDASLKPPEQAETQATQQRRISLVLLLSEPRALDTAAVEHAVGTEALDEPVTAKPPSFVVRSGSRKFAIHSVGEQYFEKSDKVAAELKDPVLASAVRAHRAWISVDWIEKDGQVDLRKVYQQIGRITGQLVRKDTLAIYSPDTGQFHVNDNSLLEHLKSDDPLRDLVQVGSSDAQITIRSDDPRLKAAEAEAKERWSEFLRAFKERREDQYFAVKGRILEGDKVEYLWLEVSDIDDKLVHGKLDNDPVTLKKTVRGADLHIPIDEVDDWLYSRGSGEGDSSAKENIVGAFTLRLFDQLNTSGKS